MAEHDGTISRASSCLFATLLVMSGILAVFIPAPVAAAPPARELQLGGHGSMPWSVDNIEPGDHGIENLTLKNIGPTDGHVVIWVTNITQYDFAGDGPHLADYMLFDVQGPGLVTNIGMPTDIYSMPMMPESIGFVWLLNLHAGQTINVEWHWEFNDTLVQQNDAQGDVLRFDINYALGDPDPPLGMRWIDIDMLGYHTWGLLNNDGSAFQTIEAWDETGTNALIIDEGTFCLCEGNDTPLSKLQLDYLDDVPPYPLYRAMLASTYYLQGYSPGNDKCDANLSGKATMYIGYDPARMPAKTVVIGLYQFNGSAWNPIAPPPFGNLFLGRASGLIANSGTFAVMATFNTSASPYFIAGNLDVKLSENRLFDPITFIKDVGKTIVVTVTITNVGDVQGTQTVTVMLNNRVAASKEVTLGPLERTDVVFTISDLEQGDYRLEVAGLSEHFSVGTYIDWILITVLVWLIATFVAFFVYAILRWRHAEAKLKSAEKVLKLNADELKIYHDLIKGLKRGLRPMRHR